METLNCSGKYVDCIAGQVACASGSLKIYDGSDSTGTETSYCDSSNVSTDI